MQRYVPLHAAQTLCYFHTIFFYRFIYWSVLLWATFLIRFSVFIVVGTPTHLQRWSILKIKIFAITIVLFIWGCQIAFKLGVIIPHTFYKRSNRWAEPAIMLRSQHAGEMMIVVTLSLLPSTGKNHLSSESLFAMVTFPCSTSQMFLHSTLMLRWHGWRSTAHFWAEKPKVVLGKCQLLWQMLG